MAFQGGRNLLVKFKSQSTAGTLAASGSGATRFRVNEGSPGLNLTAARIASGENRGDGLSTRDRQGSHSVQGSYQTDMSIGSHDALYEAVFRGTWSAAATLSESDSLGNLTVSSGVVTFATGGLTALGKVKVGDILTCASGLAAADVSKRLRVTAATNTTMTLERVDGVAITDVGSAATTYSFTRHKKLIQGITRRAFTVEEAELDIDGSELYDFVRFTRLDIGLTPDNMAIATFGAFGRTATYEEGSDAPYFTGDSPATTLGLVATDAKIKLGSETLADVLDFQFSMDLRGSLLPVVGSKYTPDVFDNSAQIQARITGLREDFARFQNFLDEDRIELHVMLRENESAPEDFIALAVTNLTLANPTKSPIGQDGARTQSYDLVIGADDVGGLYDQTMVKMITSAA